MTSHPLPPLRDRPLEKMDPIWFLAFPAYYAVMFGYGLFASIYFLPSVNAVASPSSAQLFGMLIAGFSLAAGIGSVWSILRQKPAFEFWSTIAILLLMVTYTGTIYYSAVLMPDGRTRPGSAFVPILFSVFPFTRTLVIWRSGRLPRISRRRRSAL